MQAGCSHARPRRRPQKPSVRAGGSTPSATGGLGSFSFLLFQGTDQAVQPQLSRKKLTRGWRLIHDHGSFEGATGRSKWERRLPPEAGAAGSAAGGARSPGTSGPVSPHRGEANARTVGPRGILPSPHAFLTSEPGNSTEPSGPRRALRNGLWRTPVARPARLRTVLSRVVWASRDSRRSDPCLTSPPTGEAELS